MSVSPHHTSRDVDPGAPAWRSCPHAVLGELRERGDGVHWLPHLGVWLVTRHEDIVTVLSDPDRFSARTAQMPLTRLDDTAPPADSGPVPVLSDLDPPGHTRIRRAVAKWFTSSAIDTLAEDIEWVARTLVDRLVARPNGAELMSLYAKPVPAHVMLGLLGFDLGEHDRIMQWCGHKLLVQWGRPSRQQQRDAHAGMRQFWHACEELVGQRVRERRADLTSRLLDQNDADDSAKLSLREITSVVHALASGGGETTSGLIANTVRAMLARRTWWEAALDDDVLDQVVDEVLRLDSSVITWRRRTTRPVHVGGTEIPGGADLLLGLASAGRDPRVWGPDADTLRPDRERPATHLSFGFGAHYCLGHYLARLECRIAVHTLRATVPDLEEMAGTVQWPSNIALRRPEELWVRSGTHNFC